MNYRIVIPKSVQKQLDGLPEEVRARTITKILSLAEDPRSPGTKKLKGYSNEYRVRVGDYRVRYEINDKQAIVTILNCRYRRDAYKD